MASWQNYWRIVTPASRKNNYTNFEDSANINGPGGGYASFAAISWFGNLMKGAQTRLTRYKQYDSMDFGDVARALDIIAEEISNPDRRTGLPFIIEYQTEENQDISDTLSITVRAALRHWCRFHSLDRKIYNIARLMAKYGDCFFRKTSDTKTWEFIEATRVIGIELNDVGEKIAYHVRPSILQSQQLNQKVQTQSVEIVPVEAMIHFTLSDDMGESAPFGLSLLQPAFRDWRKLQMLEDAAIIYRIVRAPERRVFYIDTGNMPPQRVKQYLESVKNDIRQKRIPSNVQDDQVDSQYNPECLALDTDIPLLDGRTLSLQNLIDEHKTGKVNWVYSCNPSTGEIVPGIITWAGVTRKNAERIKLTFDNGKSVIVTPDHKFPIRGKGFVEAKDIQSNDSLFPFNTRNVKMYGKSDYEQIWDNQSKSWQWTHRVAANFMRDHETHLQFGIPSESDVVHHVDFNRFNNSPSNLMFMESKAHLKLHQETKAEWWASLSGDRRAEVVALIAAGTKTAVANIPPEIRAMQIEKATQKIRAYHAANKLNPSESYISWLNDSSVRIAALSNLEYIRELRRENGKINRNTPDNQSLVTSQDAISRMIEIIKHHDVSKDKTMILLANDEIFMSIFRQDNAKKEGLNSKILGTKITEKYLNKVYSFIGVQKWKELKEAALMYNHKIVSVESVDSADVGTITIDGRETFHDHHTFALSAGVFTKNSIQEDMFFPTNAAGRGSRVETLPGGTTWETPELDYFLTKVFRALRVPTSYMRGADASGAGAQYNDGKVGIAYIEELRFANFIIRLQTCLEEVFDEQFKIYLNTVGINIDDELFSLRLPDPQNFALYRQSALDSDLINSFKSIEDTDYLSKRFILKRYLGLTEDDIQMNETMLKQERNIADHANVDQLQQIYDPNMEDSEVAKPEFEPMEPNGPDADASEPPADEPPPEEEAEEPEA